MQGYYVYVLFSQKDKQLYVGYSADVKRRLMEHNAGKSKSTQSRTPLALIFYEYYSNMEDAKRREMYFKTTFGKKALKVMLHETLVKLDYRHI